MQSDVANNSFLLHSFTFYAYNSRLLLKHLHYYLQQTASGQLYIMLILQLEA